MNNQQIDEWIALNDSEYSTPTQFYAAQIVKQLRDENAALKAQVEREKWVKVTERLPEHSGFYLTLDTYSESLPIKMNRFHLPYWQMNHSTVTHWRELPEPPKE